MLKILLLGTFWIGLLFAAQVQADTLTDLRTTLRGLDAKTGISGTLTVQSGAVKSETGDDKQQDGKQKPPAHIQFDVDAGAGLGIHLSPTLLEQIAAEQQRHAQDPEQATPVSDLLSQVGPMDIERIVSAVPWLLKELDGATSPTTKPTEKEAAGVQTLSVNIPLKLSKKDSSNVSDYQSDMTFWLDTQGMPLAYRQTIHAKFCKFFLCVTVDETRNGKLQAIGGRLVTVSYTDETKQSGLGQDGDTRTVYTLMLDK
ncbi:MAG TPA: hypothetical protein VFX47_07930 [Gammaproteobacteria bacterium]|nr:hypothetical protein [Gammaproteobacteria bacterium]